MTKEYKPSGHTYRLKTYQDFMDLTTEQFNMCIADFLEWRKMHDVILQSVALTEQMTGEPPEVILPDHFEWIDDGETNGTGTIEVVAPEGIATITMKTKSKYNKWRKKDVTD